MTNFTGLWLSYTGWSKKDPVFSSNFDTKKKKTYKWAYTGVHTLTAQVRLVIYKVNLSI